MFDRFNYCQRHTVEIQYYTEPWGPFPAIYRGTTRFDYEVVGQGDNRDRRARLYSRVVEDSIEYRWLNPIDALFVAPSLNLHIGPFCRETNCTLTPSPVRASFATWDNRNTWYYWDLYNDKSAGAGRDKIGYSRFYFEFQSTGGGYVGPPAVSESRQLRCDSANYFKQFGKPLPEACIFNEVVPHLTYDTQDPQVADVANHIKTAQNTPNATYPSLAPPGQPWPRDKRIPGKFTGRKDDPGLHRIADTNTAYRENRAHKNGACYERGRYKDLYRGVSIPVNQRPGRGEQCDEYPFAATLEGAAHPYWDFSVKAVSASQNGSAGARLQGYHVADRILRYDLDLPLEANDRYYVEIRN